jgi:hypothetical protein
MRTTLSVVALVMLAVSMPHAQLGVDEALTIDNTAGGVALASATTDPAGQRQAVYCRGKLETAQIRYLVNGDAPSTTVGELVNIGDIIEVFGHEHIAAARFIRTGAVSGAVHFTCYSRYPPWVSQ